MSLLLRQFHLSGLSKTRQVTAAKNNDISWLDTPVKSNLIKVYYVGFQGQVLVGMRYSRSCAWDTVKTRHKCIVKVNKFLPLY